MLGLTLGVLISGEGELISGSLMGGNRREVA